MKTDKRKTLVILSPGFPENEADTTCVPPQQVFVKALKETYPQLHVVVLTFQYPFFSAVYHWHGVKVISFGSKHSNKIFRLMTNLRVWAVLYKLNREEHLIGLLSFWFGKCAYAASRFAKLYQVKHYSWILGQDARAGNKYFHKIKPAGESLIALSNFITKEFSKNYGVTPAHVIPVGIDKTLFTETGSYRDIDILGAGALIPLKQYCLFLSMIKSLKKLHPTIKAAICGDGPEKYQLESKIKALGLQDNVSMLGRLLHQEVLLHMQRSKIFLHPSAYEGFGAVCLEALYAGADVVSFVNPMNTAIRNWHIATDQEEMLQLLAKLLKQPERDRKPVMPYSIEENVKKMMKLFDDHALELIRVQQQFHKSALQSPQKKGSI